MPGLLPGSTARTTIARARAIATAPPPQGVRQALLHTLAGRAILAGLAARIVIYGIGLLIGPLPALLGVVDTVAGMALAAGAASFVVRLLIVAQRHLLWRVRDKLILSYIFIGFTPVLLIASFFLLCGFLLFYNFSSYMVQNRLKALGDEARFLARSTGAGDPGPAPSRDAADIIARRQGGAAGEFAGVSFAVVPMDRSLCRYHGRPGRAATAAPAIAGPWSHVEPPRSVPRWIDCSGFAGLLAYSTPAGGDDSRGRTDAHPRARGRASQCAAACLRGDRRPAGHQSSDAAAAPRDRRGGEGRHGPALAGRGGAAAGSRPDAPPRRAETGAAVC